MRADPASTGERPLRVVQVSGYLDPAGRPPRELLRAWPSLLDVARAAAGAGLQVHVVQAASADERLSIDGVELHFVAARGAPGRLRPLAASSRLVGCVRGLRPDVIHLHSLAYPVLARRLAALGAPLLVQDHGDVPMGRLRFLQRWGLAKVAGALFTDAALAEPFRGVLPPVPVHPMLESSTRFTPDDRAAARVETGLCGDPDILWIGRLNQDKDPMTFLDALVRALPSLPGARAWMAFSEGELEAEVRGRLRADPRLDRVTLLGRVPPDRVQQLCRAADLFVTCSRRESTGYALLEAIASGATPVAADIPAARRILRGGRIGALFPVGDAAALAEQLQRLAAGPRDREAVLAHFREHLSFEVLGRELRAVYRAAVG